MSLPKKQMTFSIDGSAAMTFRYICSLRREKASLVINNAIVDYISKNSGIIPSTKGEVVRKLYIVKYRVFVGKDICAGSIVVECTRVDKKSDFKKFKPFVDLCKCPGIEGKFGFDILCHELFRYKMPNQDLKWIGTPEKKVKDFYEKHFLDYRNSCKW